MCGRWNLNNKRMSCLQVAQLNIPLLFPLFAEAPRKCLCSLACCSKADAANPQLTPVSDETTIYIHMPVVLNYWVCYAKSSPLKSEIWRRHPEFFKLALRLLSGQTAGSWTGDEGLMPVVQLGIFFIVTANIPNEYENTLLSRWTVVLMGHGGTDWSDRFKTVNNVKHLFGS